MQRFLRAVDRGVRLGDAHEPLVLARVDDDLPLFQSVTRYPKCSTQAVTGNPEHRSPTALHADALRLIESRDAWFGQDGRRAARRPVRARRLHKLEGRAPCPSSSIPHRQPNRWRSRWYRAQPPCSRRGRPLPVGRDPPLSGLDVPVAVPRQDVRSRPRDPMVESLAQRRLTHRRLPPASNVGPYATACPPSIRRRDRRAHERPRWPPWERTGPAARRQSVRPAIPLPISLAPSTSSSTNMMTALCAAMNCLIASSGRAAVALGQQVEQHRSGHRQRPDDGEHGDRHRGTATVQTCLGDRGRGGQREGEVLRVGRREGDPQPE